jgi:hypothetical protein
VAGGGRQAAGERRAASGKRRTGGRGRSWKTPASIFIAELLLRSLRFLSFIRSQVSMANGALRLVIARLQLAIDIRPVGRKAHHDNSGVGGRNRAAAAGYVM